MENYEDYLKQVADLGGANSTSNSFLEIFLRTEYGEGYTYEGDLQNNLPNGNGVLYYPNKQLYAIGTWANGRLQNNAKVYYDNGNLWKEGNFKNGKLEGFSKRYQYGIINGRSWITMFETGSQNDQPNGYGKFYSDNQLLYEGNFVNGQYSGLGKQYENFGNGKSILHLQGTFKDNKLNGYGKKYYKNFRSELTESYLAEEGIFVDNELEGEGKTFHRKGHIEYIGIFSQGRLKEGRHYFFDNEEWYEGKFIWDSKKDDDSNYINYTWRLVNGVKKRLINGSEKIIATGNFKESYGMYGD